LSPSIKITRTISAILALTGALAVAAAFAIGLTGWPPARAHAEFAPSTLGVSETSVVSLAAATSASDKFAEPVSSATAGLASTAGRGTLGKPKAKALAKVSKKRRVQKTSGLTHGGSWRVARVSWYGPGFYGNTMAGGGRLMRDSMVVAHRSLPFGTRVQLSYRGRSVTAVVRDRGPYVAGRVFDLGPGTARSLRFNGVAAVRYRIVSK